MYKRQGVFKSGVSGTDIVWQRVADTGAEGQYNVELRASAFNKTTGAVSLTIAVWRTENRTGVNTRKQGIATITTTYAYTETTGLDATFGSMKVVGDTGGTTEAATLAHTTNKLNLSLGQDKDFPIVRNTVFFTAISDAYNDSVGNIYRNGVSVGSIDYKGALVVLNQWSAGLVNKASLISMLRENDPVPLANLVFRTPVAPLKKASLQISAELADGTMLSLSTDAQGGITGSKYAHGTVDFKAGFVALYFYEKLGVTANPSIVNESWYDAANIYMDGGTNYINKPIYVKPDSIRYNAIAYSYLPLDKELIGLDPVRLPTDGRVPFVRKGDSIAITELKTMQLPTNAPNDTFDLGFERLSDVSVVDVNGLKVDSDYLDVDLDAGTLTLNGMFDMSFYTAPLTAKYRIMDIALVIETDISGRVTLSTPITHDYSTAAVFSSMLLAGDMQARAHNVFSQKAWGGVFSDRLIGDRASAQLQVTNNPIVVTNRDAIEERWALVITNVNTSSSPPYANFKIIGETIGEIGAGTTISTTSPINPMTGYPYFTIPAEAWGTGWSANNAVRFNTLAAKYPVWIGNAIQQHQGSSKDNYDFTIGYHANIDRDRGE